ncbi:hemolysin family protein [Candidatus Woesearchaeota archaeon]|nr:hemolysin family protein [Candidatus Woesearchaeota archaeon]
MTLIYKIIGLAVSLFFSAFFSSSETALVSMSRLRVRHMIKHRKRGAKALRKLKDNPRRMLITILIGNNLANVTASALATWIAMDIFKGNAISYAIGIMTFLILVFGEITPKSFASYHNKRFSLFVAEPIWILSMILYPFVIVFGSITTFLLWAFGFEKKKKPVVTEAEIKTIVEMGEDVGAIKKTEEALIKNVFRFDDVSVEDIMTPRDKVFSRDCEEKLKDAISVILRKHYTRIPVYRKNPDNIMGMVSTRSILRCFANRKTNIPLRRIMRPTFYIYGKSKLDLLLKQFLSKNVHMAVVIDEEHKVQGIVTLEDALEELVGEITDEKEIEALKIRQKIKK